MEFTQQTEHFFAVDTVGIGLCTKGTINGHKNGLGTVLHFSNNAETKTEADCINYFVILGAMCIEKNKKKERIDNNNSCRVESCSFSS